MSKTKGTGKNGRKRRRDDPEHQEAAMTKVVENMIEREETRQLVNKDGSECKRNGPKVVPADIIKQTTYWLKVSLDPPVTDEEYVDRVAHFFDRVTETGEVMTWEKFCLAIGHTRKDVGQMLAGVVAVSPRVLGLIIKSREILSSFDAQMALKHKYSAPVYIYRDKQYYGGKTDKMIEAEAGLIPENTLAATMSPKEIFEKYTKDVTPPDDPE